MINILCAADQVHVMTGHLISGEMVSGHVIQRRLQIAFNLTIISTFRSSQKAKT
jgi:hypothetical protein